ncbi:MAG: hypothetical protein ACLP59_31365 [Bryobacteraceae bacterium]
MLRFTLTTSSALAMLLLSSPARMAAAGDTPVTVKDGGSILLIAYGLDAGTNWKIKASELRHLIGNGTLTGVKITEAGADKCAGDAKCGVDPTQRWTIQVNYGAVTFTISSVSGNKGFHVKFPHNALFTQWQKTANGDEREFGSHGDGGKITGITVNGGPNLCAGQDGCLVTVVYTTP